MTRINVVDPIELTDQHLLAEYRELPRALSGAARAALRGKSALVPERYTLGVGHVRFFYARTDWLVQRQSRIVTELISRGYRPRHVAPLIQIGPPSGWTPDGRDREVNLGRLRDRLRAPPRPDFYTFHGQSVGPDFYGPR